MLQGPRCLKPIILVGLMLLLPAGPSADEPVDPASYGKGWSRIESGPHMTFYSNGRESTVRSHAASLARLEEVFAAQAGDLELKSPLHTHVFVFKDRDSLRPFLAASRHRKRTTLSGLFMAHSDANYILVDGSAGGHPLGTVYHEYVHYLLNTNFEKVPLWFNEGLAEFYSTLIVGKDFVEIGRAIPHHMTRIQTAPFLPVEQIFAMNHSSREYNEDSRAGILYSESWALVHYFLLGRPGHEAEWTRFLKVLAGGASHDEALEAAFEIDGRGLDQELLEYAESEKWPSRKITIQEADRPVPKAASLTAPVVLTYLGDLMSHMEYDGNPLEAEPWYKAALAADPAHGEAAAGLDRLRTFMVPDSAGVEKPVVVSKETKRISALLKSGQLDLAIQAMRDLMTKTTSPSLLVSLREKISEVENAKGDTE